MACVYFGLVLISGSLFVVVRQIDAVLGRMSAIGGEQGTGVSFPLDADRVDAFRRSWQRYQAGLDQLSGTESVRSPQELHLWLLVLDIALSVVTLTLLVLVLQASWRLPRDDWSADTGVTLRPQVQVWVERALWALFPVAIAEQVLLYLSYGPAAADPRCAGLIVTVTKWSLLAIVLGTLLVNSASACRKYYNEAGGLRKAVASTRGVLVAVSAMIVLMLLLPLGARQIDDVVRAWTIGEAVWALVAAAAAAWVVLEAARELTNRTPENLHGKDGKDPQDLLLLAAIGVAGLGGLSWAIGLGWGLLVAAGLLLVIWLGSRLVVEHTDPALDGAFSERAGTVVRTVCVLREPATPTEDVAREGRRLGRMLGAAVCLALVWTLARASAFDLVVRADPVRGDWVVALVITAGALTGLGFWIVQTERSPCERRPWAWSVLSAASVLILLLTFLVDATAVDVPFAVGSVALVMIGVSAAAGLVVAVAMLVRRIGLVDYQLPGIFRLMHLQRFPVIVFVVAWALVVAEIDPGGFHDVRRKEMVSSTPPPTLAQAYQAWWMARPEPGPRPLVIVAAQGGGIRAAVWTALVMECVFGPTPVQEANNVCAGNVRMAGSLGDRVRQQPLSAFAASGTSGGSVGLAAWSARRVDLAEPSGTVPGIPQHVDDVLDDDYIAPDMARLFSGDVPYLLAAHGYPDRAELLERSWERSWGGPDGGLSRGLRASFGLANGAPQTWRIPVLLLNGSQVEDGCRFVASPVDLVLPRTPGEPMAGRTDHPDDATCGTGASAADPTFIDALPRTNELIDYLCADEDVPLSTAAHLSARFPYVSPIARVPAEDCAGAGSMPDGAVSYITDGGMADNSGASTAAQLWRALRPEAAAAESAGSCVIPIFLQIDNSVDQSGNASTTPPLELLGPGQALVNRFGGQESAERAAARQEFGAVRTAGGQTLIDEPAWFRIAPSIQPGVEPPLGWTLAPATVADMRMQMLSGNNKRNLVRLRQLLAAPPRCPLS
jgi:hypothetical protein